MKKIFLFLSVLMTATLLQAQSPLAFKYQAVVRDASGTVQADKNVSFRISIIQGTVTGTIIYTEKHYTRTNSFGLVDLEIGKGTVDKGTFEEINWGASRHFINLEIDPNGGTEFQFMGASELLSVPYALHARTVEFDQVNDADADPANELQVLQLEGTQLTLSKGGGTVTLPSTGGGDNWGSQTVTTDASLSGDGTSARPLKIADNGVNSAKILDGSIVTDDIANSTVTADKLGNLSVSTEKLLNTAVTSDKLAANAVNTEKISAGAVTGDKIAQSGATSGQVLKWNGTLWTPADDASGVGGDNWGSQTVVSNTGYFVGNGTTASPLSLSSMGASVGQVLKYNGTSWDNDADDNGPFTDSNNPSSVYYSGSKKVGIGINTPTQKVTVAEGDNSCYMNIQNSSTGYTVTDGLLVGMNDLDGWISTYENGRLLLGTNSSAKMTILANGDVGIGTSSPAYQLDVAGPVNLNKNTASGIALRCNGAEAIWYNGTYFSWGYGATYNYFGDRVSIGTSVAPEYALVVNGTAAKTGGGSWSNLSDSRMKNLIGNYEKGLNEIIALQPVRFTYKEGNPRELDPEQEQIGFVAQDVQKIFPEAVNQCNDGYLDFNMHTVNVALVNAVKDLKAENDRLKAEINHVTAEFESRLAKLESLAGVRATK